MRKDRDRIASVVVASLLSLALLKAPARGDGFDPSPDYATLGTFRQAVEVLEKALEAHGGLQRILAVRDVTAASTGILHHAGRGLRPELPGPEDTFDGIFILDFDDDWLYLRRHEVTFEGIQRGILTILRGETGERVLQPGSRTTEISGAAATSIKSLVAGRVPFLALRDAWQDRAGLRSLGEATYQGRRHHLLLVHREGLPLTLFIDAETYRVSKTEHLVAHATFGDTVEEVEFSDYRTVDGLLVPFRRFQRQHGLPLRDVTYTDFRINTEPVMPGKEDEPADTLAEASTTVTYPVIEELAPKVHFVRLDRIYSVLVLTLKDRLLMVDAPTNSAAMDASLAAIRAELGDLPVGWVVLTHHHFDHLSGLRPLLAEGATVVAEPRNEAIVEAIATRPRTLDPDRYSREPKPLRFQPVSGKTTLGEGDLEVELYPVGPTGESEDMLIVYLPAHKLLFQADLLTLLDGRDELPPADAKNLQLAAAIDGLELDVDRLICSHGGEADLAEFRAAVSRAQQTASAP